MNHAPVLSGRRGSAAGCPPAYIPDRGAAAAGAPRHPGSGALSPGGGPGCGPAGGGAGSPGRVDGPPGSGRAGVSHGPVPRRGAARRLRPVSKHQRGPLPPGGPPGAGPAGTAGGGGAG